ncbi:MAG: GIY-YIG nuclease family protein [Candidatus Thermoplasmatota archaeon]|jgi:Uri superfamily endonuclease
MKGTYLLVLELQNKTSLPIGKLGLVDFQKGNYVYVGSALNGLEQRIQRHLRSQKKTHWHIDYLLPHTKIMDVFYKEGTRREECMIASVFEKNLLGISGFGCSDCSCNSHLFRGSLDAIGTVAASVSMERYLLGATKKFISTQNIF